MEMKKFIEVSSAKEGGGEEGRFVIVKRFQNKACNVKQDTER